MWPSVKKVIKYALGFALCLIGLVEGLSGQLTVSKNGGPAHPDKLLQYLVGGVFFLIGVLFIVAAARTRAKKSGTRPAYYGGTPGYAGGITGVTPPSHDDVDRQAARAYAEESQRQLDNLEREAEQNRIWGSQ